MHHIFFCHFNKHTWDKQTKCLIPSKVAWQLNIRLWKRRFKFPLAIPPPCVRQKNRVSTGLQFFPGRAWEKRTRSIKTLTPFSFSMFMRYCCFVDFGQEYMNPLHFLTRFIFLLWLLTRNFLRQIKCPKKRTKNRAIFSPVNWPRYLELQKLWLMLGPRERAADVFFTLFFHLFKKPRSNLIRAPISPSI